MKRLKIAFLSCGTLIHIYPYLQFFRDRGHDVYWITYDRPEKDFGVPTYDISHGACARNALSKWRYILSGISIRKILKEIKPDILSGYYATSAGVISLMSGFRPYVISVQGSDLIASMKSVVWKGVLRKVFDKSALVHTVSGELTALARTLGVPEEKIITLTHGVDVALFDYRPVLKIHSPVRLICTRTLKYPYEPETILNACELLYKKNIPFRLTFTAGGPSQKQLQRLAAEKGLADYITFMGGYDNTVLPELLHNNDIYVSASLWDGTSISLLEAMSCGIFPIVSRIASNQAWLEEGKTALMFGCEDSSELADKITFAISDELLRSRAVLQNRHLVEEKADRQKNLQKLEEMYCRLAK